VANFQYKARAGNGSLVVGQLAADNVDQAAQRLIATGVWPVEIVPAAVATDGSASVTRALRRLGLGKVKTADLVLFSRQMYTVVKAGIPLLRGLRGLASSTHNVVLRETLEAVLSDLEGGRDLATSLARYPDIFPAMYISMVRVGETTGTLEKAFLRLTEHLAQEKDMRDRVRGAVRYPIIVIVTILLAAVFLSTVVIPKFEPIFRELHGNIPLPTRLVMGASTLIRSYWHLTLAGVALALFGLRRYIGTTAGRLKWDRWKLRVPVIGALSYQAALARLCRSLAISLNAGLPMTQALQVIERSSGNVYMAGKIHELTSSIERGESLSRAASASGLFSPLVLQMIGIGEETGDLPSLLDEAAGFYEREVDIALKGLTASIEPILIVVVGGMVLVLALGIFMPMWEMIGQAGVH
jgi:MSHA biogenesis protein MshG